MANELSKMGHIKYVRNRSYQLGYGGSGLLVFSYMKKKKFKNMYLPLNKSYCKLLGAKCFNLDSPILRNNSNQEIDTIH